MSVTMKLTQFAKFVGVSHPAVVKAEKKGLLVKNKNGRFDPRNAINKAYINANQKNRLVQKVTAKISKIADTKINNGSGTSKENDPESDSSKNCGDDGDLSPTQINSLLSKNELEKKKITVETRIKEVQLAETLKEIIPFSIVRERLSRFGTILQNSLLVLPERWADEVLNLVKEKGKKARPELVTLWSKSLALAVNECKRGIREANEEW